MPYIKVNMNTIKGASNDFNRIDRKIESIQSSFLSAYKKIDWEVRDKADVTVKVHSICNSLVEDHFALSKMKHFMDNAYIKYADVSKTQADDNELFKIHIKATDVIEWASKYMKDWISKHKPEIESWMEHLKDEQQNFIDKMSALFNVEDGNYAEKLVAIIYILNNPIEVTALSIRWLAYRGTQEGWYDEFFENWDFVRDDQGIFHVDVDHYNDEQWKAWLQDKDGFCWQQLGGYTEAYDYLFDAFCDMQARNDITFETRNGENYTIWLWKGEYLNLGAGGELGIYKGDGDVLDCATDTELKVSMSIDYGDGTPPSTWNDETWWITSFNPEKQDYKAENITITYMIDFSSVDPIVWEGFKEKYGYMCNIDNKTATIVF